MSDTQPTFDEQVAALRGTVAPKDFAGRKGDATPEQWAAALNMNALRYRKDLEKSRKNGRESMARRYADPAKRSCILAGNARWKTENPDYHKEYGRQYQRSRRADSVDARLAGTLRNQLFKVLRVGRKGSAVRNLGCSVADLRAHIESQFEPGMSWENWGNGVGQWSIDHAYPCSKADLTDRSQFLAVANWRNLRPMWHDDNVRKGDAINDSNLERFEVLANFLSLDYFTEQEANA